MKTWLHAFLFVLVSSCLVGCPHPPRTEQKKSATIAPDKLDDVLASLVAAATDTARLGDVLHRCDSQINAPERSQRLKLTDQQRDFLRKNLWLSEDPSERELEEVESTVFSQLDVRYLESCFLLRNPARAIEATDLPRLKQVQLALDWVCRQVILCAPEGRSWIPSYVVLKNGVGNAYDRALLFLDLLRQMRIEGCVLEGKHPLVGVLLPREAPQDKADQLFLFDPAMGAAIPGPSGIATLDNVANNRKLLAAIGLQEEDLLKREFSLDAPLSALAPRMMVLEDLLILHERSNQSEREQVVLYIGAADEEHKKTVGERLQKDIAAVGGEIEKIAKKKVRTGNPEPPKDSKEGLPNSATRCLRWSLPPDDGGRPLEKDKAKEATQRKNWITERINNRIFSVLLGPEFYPLSNLAKLDLLFLEKNFPYKYDFTNDLLEKEREVVTKFVVEPRDLLLRGQWEEMFKRLIRLQRAFETLEFNFDDQSPLSKELNIWRKEGLDAYENRQLGQKGPNPSVGKMEVSKFWNKKGNSESDLNQTGTETIKTGYYHLLDVNAEFDPEKFPSVVPEEQPKPGENQVLPSVRPTMLTNVVFGVCKDLLDQNRAYLQAECAHEKAVSLQASADYLRGKKESYQAELLLAKNAWVEAAERWENLARPMGADVLKERLDNYQKQRYPPMSLPALLPHLLHEWSLSCSARLNYAAVQVHLAQAAGRTEHRKKHLEAARDSLGALKQDLDDQIQDSGGKLKQSFDKFQEPFKQASGPPIDMARAMGKELHGGDSSILSAYSRLVQIRLKELAAD